MEYNTLTVYMFDRRHTSYNIFLSINLQWYELAPVHYLMNFGYYSAQMNKLKENTDCEWSRYTYFC